MNPIIRIIGRSFQRGLNAERAAVTINRYQWLLRQCWASLLFQILKDGLIWGSWNQQQEWHIAPTWWFFWMVGWWLIAIIASMVGSNDQHIFLPWQQSWNVDSLGKCWGFCGRPACQWFFDITKSDSKLFHLRTDHVLGQIPELLIRFLWQELIDFRLNSPGIQDISLVQVCLCAYVNLCTHCCPIRPLLLF